MVVRANGYVHGIVLAGVHLWEDTPFNSVMPRPLLPVVQRPLIGHVLRWLRQAGIVQATICANSTSRFVRKYLGNGAHWKIDLDYYEDWTPRGPAGCIHDAALHIQADTFIIADGTIIPQLNLADLLSAHEQSKACVTVVVSPEPSNPGASREHLVPSGIYVFDRRVLQAVCKTGYQDIKEVLIPRLYEAGLSVATYVASAACPRVTSFDSYLEANSWLLHQMANDPSCTPLRYNKVRDSLVHQDAQVDPAAQLIGPVMVGPRARLEAGAWVVGPCVVGADSLITTGAVVCRSVLWERCRVSPQSAVDRCVLTQDAYVELGARLLNRVHSSTAGHTAGWRTWLHPWKTRRVAGSDGPGVGACPGAVGKGRHAKPPRTPVEATPV